MPGERAGPMPRLQFPPHDLVIDEDRFLMLLGGSLSLLPIEKKRIFASVPGMTQEQHDHIVSILETEKTQIDAISKRGEKIRRFIASVRIMAALDWAEVTHGLSTKRP